MAHLFETIFYQPLLNLLVYLYNTISFHDMGVAIIILTVIIKLVLWPLSRQAIKSQKSLQELQPKIDELKKKYEGDKQKMGAELMNLYKVHKINPFSSCLPLLIQFPFLLAVFQVFRDGISNKLNLIYSFVEKPEVINNIAFGFLNLSKPNIVLAVLAGAAQFWQAKMMLSKKPEIKTDGAKDENMANIMNKQMTYMMPILTVFIGISLPGGLTFYWFLTTVLTAIQQLFVFKKKELSSAPAVIEGNVVEKK